MRQMNTLIVDDERLARRRLRRFLSKEPDITIAGECANIRQASDLASSAVLDLMFLDVEMPNSDVFEFVKSLPGERMPIVIFVTAYEQYAVRAFEVAARDYLLKPVEEARFREALQRARVAWAALKARATTRPGEFAVQSAPEERSRLDAVLIRANGKVSLLKTQAIDWIETEGNYVRLHAGRESHVLRETIAAFELKLDRSQFVRIHRSAIVNVERVVQFESLFNGNFSVLLKDGKQLRMSRTYRDRVHDLLGRSV